MLLPVTDQTLFYGGMALAGGSALAAFLFFCVFQIRRIRLNARLDAEYGRQEKSSGKRKKPRWSGRKTD